MPRERTPQGRLLEHASDSKPLITHLLAMDTAKPPTEKLSEKLFYVSSKENDSSAALVLKREYVSLTLSANGKAELYFHAYVWTAYTAMLSKEFPEVQSCSELKRMAALSLKPKQVTD